jgi:hypothetical protein
LPIQISCLHSPMLLANSISTPSCPQKAFTARFHVSKSPRIRTSSILQAFTTVIFFSPPSFARGPQIPGSPFGKARIVIIWQNAISTLRIAPRCSSVRHEVKPVQASKPAIPTEFRWRGTRTVSAGVWRQVIVRTVTLCHTRQGWISEASSLVCSLK